MLEQAEMRQSTRLMKSGFDNAEDKETLFRLEKNDFNLPALMPKKEHKRSIGFVSRIINNQFKRDLDEL